MGVQTLHIKSRGFSTQSFLFSAKEMDPVGELVGSLGEARGLEFRFPRTHLKADLAA